MAVVMGMEMGTEMETQMPTAELEPILSRLNTPMHPPEGCQLPLRTTRLR